MTLFWRTFSVLFLSFALIGQADAAKRFGSGGFGKMFSSPSPTRSAPQQKQQPVDSKNLNAAPNRANGGTGRGLMGGMLGGLLAGGLFAWMLGSGAFEGIQFMDILLLAGVLFILFKLLRPKISPSYQTSPDAQQHYRADPTNGFGSDSHGDNRTETNPMSSVMSTGSEAPMNLPDDFDQVAFIGAALDHYRSIQQAWNDNDLEVIRGYVAEDVYEGLVNQRAAMTVPPKTEVLDLAADIVRADQVGDIRQISLLFRGRCKDELEGSEDGIFDTWHLERDMSQEDSPWLIVGIEAE